MSWRTSPFDSNVVGGVLGKVIGGIAFLGLAIGMIIGGLGTYLFM